MIRSRSEGWSHAKIDGHDNERAFGQTLIDNPILVRRLWSRRFEATEENPDFVISVDGSKHVDSVLGGKTTSKVDVSISLGDEYLGCSIKKSDTGQVWLTSVDRFLKLLAKKESKPVDPDFKKGLRLFIGGEKNLEEHQDLFKEGLCKSKMTTPKTYARESENFRLSCGTIKELDRGVYEALLEGFRGSIGSITELAFATGAASDESDRAKLVVYNKPDKLITFDTENLKLSAPAFGDLINPGPQNGGSTIWLPWGFLQMHHPQVENLMQFHHKLAALSTHFEESCVVINLKG